MGRVRGGRGGCVTERSGCSACMSNGSGGTYGANGGPRSAALRGGSMTDEAHSDGCARIRLLVTVLPSSLDTSEAGGGGRGWSGFMKSGIIRGDVMRSDVMRNHVRQRR